MSLSVETLAVARKYTDDSLAGAGAVAGVPCKIQSITAITGGNRITFLWTDNNGDDHTSAMDVMNGVDGEDGKGIQSVTVNAQDHLIITYTDGTTVDAGQIEIHSSVDSVNGQTGAVALDAEDVGALPDNTPIPSKTSDLTNDSGFATTSDVSTALADYTKTADLTTLLAAKQDTLTFDDAPTENSDNPVKSGGIYSAKQTLMQQINTDGCKNHLGMSLSNVVNNGITYQNDGNNIITANGTVTQSPSAAGGTSTYITGLVVGETYVLSGLPESTALSGGEAFIKLYKNDNSYSEIKTTGNKTLTFTYDGTNAKAIDIGIRTVGTVVTNAVFKPMICLKSLYDADPTFAPYAKSNKELTENVAEISDIVNITNDVKITGQYYLSQAYAYVKNGILDLWWVSAETLTANAQTVVGQLPSGYRPLKQIYLPIYINGKAYDDCYAVIKTDGSITFSIGATSAQYYGTKATFFVG